MREFYRVISRRQNISDSHNRNRLRMIQMKRKKENLSKPDFSNFGEKLDFTAPGKEILCMRPKDANNGKGIIAERDFMCFALYSCNSWNYKKLQQRIDK